MALTRFVYIYTVKGNYTRYSTDEEHVSSWIGQDHNIAIVQAEDQTPP